MLDRLKVLYEMFGLVMPDNVPLNYVGRRYILYRRLPVKAGKS